MNDSSSRHYPHHYCWLFTFAGYYLAVLFLASIVLNATVLWAYFVMPRWKSLEVQTVTLLLVNIVSTLSTLPVLIESNLSCRFVGWKSSCILSGFWMYFNGMFSIYLMTGISVERYLLVSNRPRMCNTLMNILLSGILSCLWTVAPLLGWSQYSFEDEVTSCGLDYVSRSWNVLSYNVCVFTFGFFIPLALICLSTGGLLRKVNTNFHGNVLRDFCSYVN